MSSDFNDQGSKYWVFQCNPKIYDLAGALKAGVVGGWQVNQHKKDIHQGDKVIIWVTGAEGGCYALGTVTSEVMPLKEDIREAPFYTQPPEEVDKDGVTLSIDRALWENPIWKDDVVGKQGFNDFPGGGRGTNFAATEVHYRNMLEIAEGKAAMQIWKVSHGGDDFKKEEREACLENRIVVVHNKTGRGQGENFTRNMRIGDLVYLCHGNDDGIQVFARITSPATPYERDENWRQRSFETLFTCIKPGVKYQGVTKGWTPNYNSTCMSVPESELLMFESEILKPFFGKTLADIGKATVSTSARPEISLPSKNVILYGPPGTGKTYALRNKYMDCFTERVATQTKEQFADSLVADLAWWQVIVVVMLELKTCKVKDMLEHPLMKARIRRANNHHTRAAIWAHLQMHTKTGCEEVNYTKRFDPLLFTKNASAVWSIDESLAKDEVPDLVIILDQYRNFRPDQSAAIKRYEFTTFHQSYSYEDFVEGIKPMMSEAGDDSLAYEIKDGIFKTMVARALADPTHDYALIIDEISRGNVASIFGELITLIEDDKRKGASNELSARLPYSREEFVVPGNLYIIGAMNTADRSVEALDTALRRRFTFVATPPQPECIEQPPKLNVDLQQMLMTINTRVEKLKDKDHCIGHSYFMGIAQKNDSLAELKHAFATKIIPLLEEYFYGDPAKIGMVLGEKFVSLKDDNVGWAKGDWGMDEYEDRPLYTVQDPTNLTEEDFRSIYE